MKHGQIEDNTSHLYFPNQRLEMVSEGELFANGYLSSLKSLYRITRADGKIETHVVEFDGTRGEYEIAKLYPGDVVELLKHEEL